MFRPLCESDDSQWLSIIFKYNLYKFNGKVTSTRISKDVSSLTSKLHISLGTIKSGTHFKNGDQSLRKVGTQAKATTLKTQNNQM